MSLFADRGWTGVVLAGGMSSRMGRDKALIEVDGITLLERAVQRLRPHVREVLVIGDPERYGHLHPQVLPDERPGLGPLGGIVTALKRARYVRLLVLACDMPHVNDRSLIALKRGLVDGADAAVPVHGDGQEPLCAAYHRHGLEPLERALRAGRLRMVDALQQLRTVPVPVEPGSDGWPSDLFRNVNTPADL